MTVPMILGIDAVARNVTNVLNSVIGALKAVGDAALEAAKKGDQMHDAYTGAAHSLEMMREATGNEVNDLDLLQTSARAVALGIDATNEQMATFMHYGKRMEETTGKKMRPELETLFRAIATGRTASLRPFIGDVELTGTKAEQLSQVLAILSEKTEDMGKDFVTVGDKVAQFETGMDRLSSSFSRAFTESETLVAQMNRMAGVVGDNEEAAAKLGDAFGVAMAYAVAMVNAALEKLRELENFIRNNFSLFTSIAPLLGEDGEGFVQRLRRQVRQAGETRQEREDVRRQERARRDELRQEQRAGAPTRPRAGSGGTTDAGMVFTEAEVLAAEKYGGIGGQERVRQQAELNAALEEGQRSAEEQRIQRLQEFAGREAAIYNARNEFFRSNAAQRVADQEAAADRWIQVDRQSMMASKQSATTWGSLGTRHAEQSARILGLGEAEMNMIRGASELVQGWISLTPPPNPPAAAAHFGAAAFAFTTAATQKTGKGRSGGGGGGGGGGRGGGAGASFAAPGGGVGAGGGGGGGNTYNIIFPNQTGFVTKDEVRESIREAIIAAGDSGRKLPARTIEKD